MLVIILLIIIFSIAPKSAYISFNSDSVDTVENITADKLIMSLRTHLTSVTCSELTKIHCSNSSNITIDDNDDVIYNGDMVTIVFEPESNSDEGIIYILPQENDELQLDITAGKYTEYKFNEDPLVYIDYLYNAFVAQCVDDFTISQSEAVEYSFYHGNAFLMDNEGKKTPITKCKISNYEGVKHDINFDGYVTLNVFNGHGFTENLYSWAEIYLYGIKTFSSQSNGTIYFSYTPTANEYTLEHQQVSLFSKHSSMRAKLTYDKSIQGFQLYGEVNNAQISGMNLFPSFFGWYRGNIYLAPITLITAILGGVTLMLNKKKKK